MSKEINANQITKGQSNRTKSSNKYGKNFYPISTNRDHIHQVRETKKR